MNKIQKIIKGIGILFKNPSLINLILDSEFYWKNYLKRNQNNLLQLPTVDILDVIENPSELNQYSFLGGGSLPTDIVLLKSLAKQIRNCSYFEIGTWRGESVVNVAETAKECYTLNLSKEEIIAEGFPENYAPYMVNVKFPTSHAFWVCVHIYTHILQVKTQASVSNVSLEPFDGVVVAKYHVSQELC